jgi:hypothetical protein
VIVCRDNVRALVRHASPVTVVRVESKCMLVTPVWCLVVLEGISGADDYSPLKLVGSENYLGEVYKVQVFDSSSLRQGSWIDYLLPL